MAGRIPDETLQAIRDRTSLVEVVSAYVGLKRSGRNYLGLCPFHSEKTPSFTVSEERGFFHCFGCGAGGTVFNFLMRIERLEFPEAVEQLAKRAGIALPALRSNDPNAALRERMYAVNLEAAEFFRRRLQERGGEEARSYLARRDVGAQTIDRYQIGFAPPGGAALAARWDRNRATLEVAAKVGLLGVRGNGTHFDRFRGRVMFPIRDRRDRVIGFGGRTLGADQPKYLNSPESPVFHKGDALYGLSEARDGIRRADRVVLVEGYLDALLLVQEGFPYAVATLGTALSPAQLRLLPPLGGEELTVFFCFDGDAAGRKAALRAFGVCAEAGIWGRAAFLPEGFDPDSYVRGHGQAAMERLLEAAPPLMDFYFDQLVPPGTVLPQRARVAEEVKGILARVKSDVQFELLARHAAARLGIDDGVFRRARGGPGEPRPQAAAAKASAVWPPAERTLVEVIAIDRQAAEWVEREGGLDLLASRDLADAGRRIVAAWDEGRPIADVVAGLPEPLAQRLAALMVGAGPLADADRMKLADECMQRLRAQASRARRLALAAELRRAESAGDESWHDKLESLQKLRREDGEVR
jgi:DNA primase